jgi:hypothetical protein
MTVVGQARRRQDLIGCPERPSSRVKELQQRNEINERHSDVEHLGSQESIKGNVHSNEKVSQDQELHLEL